MHEITKRDPGTNTAILFGMLLGGRGVGYVLAGPLSGVLVDSRSVSSDDEFGYATKYGGLIIFTGVTCLLSAWAPFWKMLRIAKEKASQMCGRWISELLARHALGDPNKHTYIRVFPIASASLQRKESSFKSIGSLSFMDDHLPLYQP